jgi:hypothetical protein
MLYSKGGGNTPFLAKVLLKRSQILMDNKPWYQSQTIWSQIIVVAGVVTSLFGYELAPDASQEIVQAAGAVASGVAAVFGIVGRFKAGGVFIKKPSGS